MVRHFLVKGRVQGVGFRWFVHREAAALWICMAGCATPKTATWKCWPTGDADSLADLAEALHKGSRGSRVDAVISHELDTKEGENLGPFQIEGAW